MILTPKDLEEEKLMGMARRGKDCQTAAYPEKGGEDQNDSREAPTRTSHTMVQKLG